jgi:glycosidase
VLSKLDYLVSLGVDALWLSPGYKSLFVDMGYDISNYKAAGPRFGDMIDTDSWSRDAMHEA